MKYTDNDFKLYKALMKASKDGICYRLPTTITQRDVERLCDLGMCDRSNPNLLYLLYDDYELQDLEEEFQRYKDQQADEKATIDAERAYLDQQTQKQFRHDWRITIVGCAINFALGAILDHFFDIVGYAADLWRSLFP